MTRKRTTKALASRIQLDYLKKFRLFSYWKRIAIVSALLIAVLWLLWGMTVQENKIYAPGPISSAHRMFEATCSQCHLNAWSPVPNQSCLNCHANLIHHEQQNFVPRCASCHWEHHGPDLVGQRTANGCVDCHRNLERKDGKPSTFATHIERIDRGHPEFRFLTASVSDTTSLKLNHKIHMKPELEGPNGEKVTLGCSDCHGVDREKDPEGVYRRAPFSYERQCLDCHSLGFDQEFPQAVAPHETPEKVRQFIATFYKAALKEDPHRYLQKAPRQRPGPEGRRPTIQSAKEWYAFKTAAAEKQLFGRTCLACHRWDYRADTLPEVPRVEAFPPFLTYGRFHHAPHRPIACASCHAEAVTSEQSTDLLVPGIQICLNCHGATGIAGDSCVTCHRYHPPGLEKMMEGILPIEALR